MKKILFLLLLISYSQLMFSQNEHNDFCGYQHEIEKIKARNPGYEKWQNQMFQNAMYGYLSALDNSKRRIVADTISYEIKVVYHILHNNNDQNISETYIVQQMEALNQAFRKTTKDTQRIREIFKKTAADTKIQFVLATTDPDGNPTNGITRTATTKTTFAINTFGAYSTDMKYSNRGGKTAWDPTKYLNIWICNMRFPNQVSMTLGFATPPTGSPNWVGLGATKDTTDLETGIVAHFSTVGYNHPDAIGKNVEGLTMIHEAGHYLGLRHTWGDFPSSGCSVDDGIFDTPNARDRNFTCNRNANSCTDAIDDKPDMIENYMDYALDGCAGMFTNQQAYMMRFILNNLRIGIPSRKITLDTINDNFEAVIYPNPLANGKKLQIDLKYTTNENFNIKIIDYCGKEIMNQKVMANQTHIVNTDALASAAYFLIISNEKTGKINAKKTIIIQ